MKQNYTKIAKQRASRLEKSGIDNNALKAYRAMMKTARTAKQKAKISKQFVNNPLSTKTGIKSEYKKKYGERPESAQQASESVDKYIMINDETLRDKDNLGSQIMQDAFEFGSYNGLSTRQIRNSLSKYFLKHMNDNITYDDMYNDIMDDLTRKIEQ